MLVEGLVQDLNLDPDRDGEILILDDNDGPLGLVGTTKAWQQL